MTSTTDQTPTDRNERIPSLDVIRGAAVLGILVMNSMAFALPSGTSFEAWHGGGPDLWVLSLQEMFFDGRMRGLFSMLFGAGTILFLERLEGRGAGLRTAELYYRRMLWLLLFGLIHAWVLLWPGDILFGYALCGLFLFPIRGLSPRRLLIAGVLLLGVNALQDVYSIESERDRWELAGQAEARLTAGKKPAKGDEDAIEWRQKRTALFAGEIDAGKRAKEFETQRGGYVEVWLDAAPMTYKSQGEGHYSRGIFDQLGAMLLGMALFRTGFFSGHWRRRSYAMVTVIGYGLVAPCVGYLGWVWTRTGTPPDAWGQLLAYDASYPFARIAVALAHASALLLMLRAGWARVLMLRLAATGRMALTHYVAQTVLVGLLLFGPVFKQFGAFTRAELMLIVAVVWIAQVAISRPWLERFRFGPLEWLWRSLTYGKPQPMRREQATQVELPSDIAS